MVHVGAATGNGVGSASNTPTAEVASTLTPGLMILLASGDMGMT